MKPVVHVMATFGDEGAAQVHLRCFLDTGVSHAVLPFQAWRQLGLEPAGSVSFRLRDANTLSRDSADCSVSTRFGAARVRAILGEPGDVAVLPATLLQQFGPVLHPFSRQIFPMAAA